MDELINKITKIQNKQQTLQWGHYQMSETELMFAVGNTAYPGEPHYFIATTNYTIFLLTDSHRRTEYRQHIDTKEVTNSVIELLKEWFPAKQL